MPDIIHKGSEKKKALFLDRDGVINKDIGYLHKIEDCEFVEGIFDICKLAVENSYLLIVVTNQSGIARGFYTEDDFLRLMDYIGGEFRRQGCPLTDVFYCPFHPDGNVPWKLKSVDRKPAPGMLLKAAEKYNLDLEECIMLGDKDSDIEAGRNAGLLFNFRMDKDEDIEKLYEVLQKNNLPKKI